MSQVSESEAYLEIELKNGSQISREKSQDNGSQTELNLNLDLNQRITSLNLKLVKDKYICMGRDKIEISLS